MKPKVLVILIVLIALVAGGFFAYQKISQPAQPEIEKGVGEVSPGGAPLEGEAISTKEGGIPTAIYDDAVWDNSGTKIAATKVILSDESWQVATFPWEE